MAFEKFIFSGLGPILVAGDSNVHRINNVVLDKDVSIKCLPISGARYTNDKKEFRKKLKACLRGDSYRQLYLFMGSNDVLISDHLFYRNITDVCDIVHEIAPSIDIVLCEIPPRRQSKGKWRIPAPKLKKMQEWIATANSILRIISLHTPYVKFLSTFLSAHHLTFDGLHLSREGAEQCYKVIVEGTSVRDRPTCDNHSSFDFDLEDWPVLGEVRIKETLKKIRYVDVVQTEAFSEIYVQNERVEKQKSTEKIKEKQNIHIKCRQPSKRSNGKSRFERRRNKWLKKKEFGPLPGLCCSHCN